MKHGPLVVVLNAFVLVITVVVANSTLLGALAPVAYRPVRIEL